MILFFAWTSSLEQSASLHCDIWQVHMRHSCFGLGRKASSTTTKCPAVTHILHSPSSAFHISMWHGNHKMWGWLYMRILAIYGFFALLRAVKDWELFLHECQVLNSLLVCIVTFGRFTCASHVLALDAKLPLPLCKMASSYPHHSPSSAFH